MIIKRLKASFGRLEADEIEFSDGLNIITAPNESGKSTWCAFICAMLYGVDSSERARSGYKPDKTRFAPWSGSPMEGEMDIVHGGREITLMRTGRPNAPMREFSAVYTGTSDPVPGMTGESAGEVLLGVPKAIFERGAFVRQSGISVSGSPELSMRIASIVTTGEEDTSFEETDARLRIWQRRRKYRNSGLIPDLETEIRAKTLQLGDIDGASRQRVELEAALRAAERHRDEIRKRLEDSRKVHRQAALAGMAEAQQEVEGCLNELSTAREDVMRRHAELAHGVFGDERPEDVGEAARNDARRAEELRAVASARAGTALPILLSVLCLTAAVAGAVLMNMILFIVAGLLLAGAVISIILAVRKRRSAAEAGRELQAILAHYSVRDPRAIIDALSIHSERWEEYEAALERKQASESRLEKAEEKQRELQQGVLLDLNFQDGDTEAVQIVHELSRGEDKVRRMRDELSAAGGRISVLGDPMALRSELSALEEQRREKNREFAAIALAIEVLGASNEEIQARFSPALSRRAGEIFSRITGRENEEVRFDRELNAMVRRESETVPRDSLFLSEGAQNALYLAVRLAICELAMPQGERCPLILDDVLMSLDDDRAQNALEFLKETAQERQIILFTCHKREKQLGEAGSIA